MRRDGGHGRPDEGGNEGIGVRGPPAVWRIARKRYQAPRNLRWTLAPFGAMVAVLAVFNIGMFLLPMAHRM